MVRMGRVTLPQYFGTIFVWFVSTLGWSWSIVCKDVKFHLRQMRGHMKTTKIRHHPDQSAITFKQESVEQNNLAEILSLLSTRLCVKMRFICRVTHEWAHIKDKTITHVDQKWLLKVIILSLMFAHSCMARRINFIFTHNLVNSNDNISAKLLCSEPSCWQVMALWSGWCLIFIVFIWPL